MGSTAVSTLQDSEFVNGLIAGSNNLINQANSSKIVSGLSTLSQLDLSALTTAAKQIGNQGSEAAQSAVSQIANSDQMTAAVASLNNIFKSLK